jgi:hypothetical protein
MKGVKVSRYSKRIRVHTIINGVSSIAYDERMADSQTFNESATNVISDIVHQVEGVTMDTAHRIVTDEGIARFDTVTFIDAGCTYIASIVYGDVEEMPEVVSCYSCGWETTDPDTRFEEIAGHILCGECADIKYAPILHTFESLR